MPGCGLGGIWMCTYTCILYWLCVFNVWTLVLTGSGTGSVILDFAGRWVWGRGPRGVVPGQLGGWSGEWMPAVLMFTYGNLMHVGHRSAVLCLLLTLLGFVFTLHRTGDDFINLTGNSDFVLVNMSEELSRSRAACRGWVTRECKNLATTLEDPELNVVKLSAAMDEFDKRLTNLDDVQSRYELSLEDEDAILNDITTAADFRDSARKVRTLASEKFKELSGDSGNKSAAHVSSFSMTDVKLTKLNLPVFNGDVLQWQSFWDQFVAAVDSTDLPDVSKFSYLRASLEGEPKAAIQGLSLTSAHYASACKILKDRFGRKETIIFSHIQKLLNLSVPSKCSVSALWKLNDDLQAHTRSLATLGIDGDKYGVILTPLILSHVPQELRLEWSRDGKGHESDLKFLLSFLEKEIQRRERSQMFQESLGPSFKSSVEERRPRVATASTLQATSTVKPSKTCCFCGKNHPTEKCFKLSGSIQVKKEKLKSAGLCFRCLLPGHIAKGCSVVCRKCNGRHHEIICGPPAVGATSAGVSKVSSPPPPSSGNVNASATHSSSTTSFVSVANSTPPGDMSASHPSVALQFARVTVHGSQGVTEATVMFDTGSDRSYVTQDLVNLVKPKWVDSEPVAFASFGSGKPSKTDLRHIFFSKPAGQPWYRSTSSCHSSGCHLCAFVASKFGSRHFELLWWHFLCRSLWDRVCCQDWYTDRNRFILAVCFTPSVVQWGSWPHCTKFSVWLDCVRLFIVGQLSISLQCISSVVVCKCLWWHCQVLLGTGVSWYCLRGLGVCSRSCVAGIWEFCWFCRWAIWGQVTLASWGIIASTK